MLTTRGIRNHLEQPGNVQEIGPMNGLLQHLAEVVKNELRCCLPSSAGESEMVRVVGIRFLIRIHLDK